MIRETGIREDLASILATLEQVNPLFTEHNQIGVDGSVIKGQMSFGHLPAAGP